MSSNSSKGGWSGSNNYPSYPGDSGGNTFTYTTPDIYSSSSFSVSGSASVYTDNSSNGMPTPSGGGVGFNIKW